MSQIFEQKQALRRQYRALRASFSETERAVWNSALANRLFSLLAYGVAKVLLLYYPVKEEPDLLPIARRALADGKRIAFPISMETDCTLRFGCVNSPEELIPGAYGIPEPPHNAPLLGKNDFSHSLCLVPGLIFDEKGFRLGYGKGYYDRFLAEFDGVCVGLVYHSLLVPSLPVEETDQAVQLIITEKEVRVIHGGTKSFSGTTP